MSLDKKCLKVLSVYMRHYVRGIILPNNRHIFHKRDGLPLKVSIESYIDIIIQCSHEIEHSFKIPIEPLIEWKIINGIKDGVFKHGYGLSSKYSDTDNENCVIYYPGIRGSKDDYKDKDIPISIRISSNKIKGSVENISTNNLQKTKHTQLTEYNTIQLLILHLKQKNGFLNKMYYESSITVIQPPLKDLVHSSIQLIGNNNNNEDSNSRYSFDVNRKTLLIENKYTKCADCKLRITFRLPASYFALDQMKIATGTNRFFSSEYIKFSNSMSDFVYGADRPDIEFDIENNNIQIDKLRISNCPAIKTKETFWTTTAGSFPCGGSNGNSVIYYSLNEKELSKSPITLKQYDLDIFEYKEEQVLRTTNEKKFWIVRKAIMGG